MRYQKIHSQIWRSETFQALSEDAQRLFFYLLTSPHSTILGVYKLPFQYMQHDLNTNSKSRKWRRKRISGCLTELKTLKLCYYDSKNEIVLIKNHLEHNPIENPNQLKACIKMFKTLPKTSLFQFFNVKQLTERLTKQLPEQLIKDVETVRQTVRQTVSDTEAVTETETEKIQPVSTFVDNSKDNNQDLEQIGKTIKESIDFEEKPDSRY